MLPLLGLLYAIALIDRTNLGIARAAGMDHDLVYSFPFSLELALTAYCGCALGRPFQHLSLGSRYSIVSFVYFIPYTIL